MPTTSNGVDVAHLDPTFGPQLFNLITDVEAHGGHVVINSGFRSKEKQQYIYDHPEQRGGRPAAVPGTSLHEKGLAADLGGDARTMQLLNQFASKYGIAGLKGDPGHYQLASAKSTGAPASVITAPVTGEQKTAGPLSLVDRMSVLQSLLTPEGVRPDTEISTQTTQDPTATVTTPLQPQDELKKEVSSGGTSS